MQEFFSDLRELNVKERSIPTEKLNIPVGEVTEICGPPGEGKTILLHQLAAKLGEKENYIVTFFDVDFSFRPELIKKATRKSKEALTSIYRYLPLDVKDFISKVRIVQEKFTAPKFFLIDSLPNLFPKANYSPEKRGNEIVRVGAILRRYLGEELTVIVSNQVRAIIKREELKKKEKKFFRFWRGDIWEENGFVPALGSLWENFIDNRLLITRAGNKTTLTPIFSSFSSIIG